MKKAKFRTSDCKLTFERVRWANETYDRFPVLRWPSGSICEPATLYFGWCLQYRRGFEVSSLNPEAFAIREWLVFMANNGLRFHQVTDLILRGYREAHKPDIDAGKIHLHTVERKLSTIYLMYRSLDSLLAVDEKGRPRIPIVAPDEKNRAYPVTTSTYETEGGNTNFVWSGSNPVSAKGTKRPTPGLDDVKRILEWIRSKPDRLVAIGKKPTNDTYFLADRDWLIARTECEGGYRRAEVGDLTLGQLWKTLRDENIFVPDSISELADCDEDTQARILKDLEALNERSPYVELRVIGKGVKSRYAPVPVRYIIDLLSVWIWKGRRAILQSRPAQSPVFNVFISSETLIALTPGAIGDLMKRAFKDARVSGSGQRLRAHYCTVTAIRLWEGAMARNGFNFSQAVYNMIMDQLADAMGHDSADTTVKYYLDLAVSKYFGFSERSKYVVFHSIWKTVADNYTELNASDIKGIVKIVEAFAKPGTERLKEVIALALRDSKLNPEPSPNPVEPSPKSATEQPTDRSHLRLAFSYHGDER